MGTLALSYDAREDANPRLLFAFFQRVVCRKLHYFAVKDPNTPVRRMIAEKVCAGMVPYQGFIKLSQLYECWYHSSALQSNRSNSVELPVIMHISTCSNHELLCFNAISYLSSYVT